MGTLRSLMVVVLVGCTATPAPLTTCSPGVQTACACPGGTQGAQRCDDTGSAFGACDCPDSSAVDSVEVDAVPDVQAIDAADVPASLDTPDVVVVADVVDVPSDRPDAADVLRVTCPAGQTACEDTCINLNTTPDHCGACDNFCAVFPHMPAQCTAGHCSGSCERGYENCNTRLDDGCEAVPTTDPRNCGMCGRVCSSGRCFNGNCAL